ncbi:hypothetical protein EXIGLDRAFT_436300 [Exidia glandulosa HHB12029]|uniref:Uncharacterized protein n=1 Tax=Exidia glandulosa HHB12029 TaxID=1314781 RepID=A0A165B8U5_EXIGL|nr:hypothetical protein EXIGLDRAFT_436300 [Exidia glandulosa HHB12029]
MGCPASASSLSKPIESPGSCSAACICGSIVSCASPVPGWILRFLDFFGFGLGLRVPPRLRAGETVLGNVGGGDRLRRVAFEESLTLAAAMSFFQCLRWVFSATCLPHPQVHFESSASSCCCCGNVYSFRNSKRTSLLCLAVVAYIECSTMGTSSSRRMMESATRTSAGSAPLLLSDPALVVSHHVGFLVQ